MQWLFVSHSVGSRGLSSGSGGVITVVCCAIDVEGAVALRLAANILVELSVLVHFADPEALMLLMRC